MTTVTFSTLPAELHVNIAKHCEKSDLINLCLTSKRLNERCLHVLYRHVDLQVDPYGNPIDLQMLDARTKREQRFVYTLLSHPEYGKHVRFLKQTLCIPSLDDCDSLGEEMVSKKHFWRAMQSLTHVQSVDIASRDISADSIATPAKQFAKDLFQSATSVRLVGPMQYGLAKSILNAINPAMLNYLCLDMVQDRIIRDGICSPGRGEDGRIIARGAMTGLLTNLTGRCTALRTLILRRVGNILGWHAAAEEASCIEWASFIRSVQMTLKKLVFENPASWPRTFTSPNLGDVEHQTVPFTNECFQRLIFQVIFSGNWPSLITIELRGVIGFYDVPGEKPTWAMELRALLGENTKIVVESEDHYSGGVTETCRWSLICDILRCSY